MARGSQLVQKHGKVVSELARLLAKRTKRLYSELVSELGSASPDTDLVLIYDRIRQVHLTELSELEFADGCAQTIACGLFSEFVFNGHAGTCTNVDARRQRNRTFDECWNVPIARHLATTHGIIELFDDLNLNTVLSDFSHQRITDPVLGFYETFLSYYDPVSRRRHGVFYTPQPIVQCIVRAIDRTLTDDFLLVDGLADTTTWEEMAQQFPLLEIPVNADPQAPFVTILDPALGTGTFLVEVIRTIHETVCRRGQEQGDSPENLRRRWNAYVPSNLIPRLLGIERLMAPHTIAGARLRFELRQTGYEGAESVCLPIVLGNSLEQSEKTDRSSNQPITDDWQRILTVPVTVVLGNPPFSGVSSNKNPWIDGLLKKNLSQISKAGHYYEVDGKPLGEKKHWLQDDYVKFIRYAQWRIEKSHAGILGYVTNHGYLDNPTFRGMRQSLMNTFCRLDFLDLHGNRKKNERTLDGAPDANIFGVEQGVAIGLFSRSPKPKLRTTIRHGDVWGKITDKYRVLSTQSIRDLATQHLAPTSPYYFFVPHDSSIRSEFEQGYSLPDIMPLFSTAVVTARDAFVIDVSRDELIRRLSNFRDLTIEDTAIRTQYFTRSRSQKYLPGDTRGWKMADARRRMSQLKNWKQPIRTCLYRPFDRRHIYWADWMIDWTRPDISNQLLVEGNLALVARRQILTQGPSNYFWITDCIVIDGVVRSDNRGTESVFPLYHSSNHSSSIGTANFTNSFLKNLCQATDLRWVHNGNGDLHDTLGPVDVLAYLYAQLQSRIYQARYKEMMRCDFPRIFLPNSRKLFLSMVRAGRRLMELHLSRTTSTTGKNTPAWQGNLSAVVSSGYPKFQEECVKINEACWCQPVSSAVWQYHVGAHQVCRKWLKDRRGRILSSQERHQYINIVNAIGETLFILDQIDKDIIASGGWADGFQLTKKQPISNRN